MNPVSATDRRGCSLPRASSDISSRVHASYQSSRRQALLLTSAPFSFISGSAFASTPRLVDQAWTAIGGGPSDLFFPDSFLGSWDVESVLTDVDLPMGSEAVPDMTAVNRAIKEDLDKIVRYKVSFDRNQQGKVVMDRKFNTASLLEPYMKLSFNEILQRIQWTPEDPNLLRISLPGGLRIDSTITRRSEEYLAQDLIETSEFYLQLFDDPGLQRVRVKASRAYTKYRWRPVSDPDDKKPLIVATQIVTDYRSPYDENQDISTFGKPVQVYKYRLSFRRHK